MQYQNAGKHSYRFIATLCFSLAATLFLTAVSVTAYATTITVTNTNDSGAGSLRQAIVTAAPGDTVNFGITGTITLTSGQLVIDKNLTIQGPGQSLLSISGNNLSRVLNFNGGVTATLDGITIRDGGGDYGEGKGRGIENIGTLTVSNSTITGNRSGRWCDELGQCTYDYGGGIANYGTLAVISSTVSGNGAGDINQQGGGGIFNSGTLTVTDSTISGNGVGCYVQPKDLGCWSGDGGGIYNDYTGTLNVNNSTISGNLITGSGGGIFNSGRLSVNNSTVSNNYIPVGYGGGILNFSVLTVTNSTISGNTAGTFGGGGIAALGADAETRLNNSIVAGNSHRGYVGQLLSGDISALTSINFANHSLIGDADSSGGITNGVSGNIVGVNPLLGPLADNGGPTLTHAVLTGSPAINAGNNCVLTPSGCGDDNPALPTDQRGFGRFGAVDIGAFELQSVTAPTNLSISGRVTTANGRGIENAVVSMTDSLDVPRTATTSTFGYYSFNNIPGDTYHIAIRSKRYAFQPRTVVVNENLSGVDFVALK